MWVSGFTLSPGGGDSRLVGVPPDTTFQFWLIVVGLLNFGIFFLFLRRIFDLGGVGAAAGAFLFAFGSPRTSQLHHPQLVPHCLVVVAL